MLRCNCEYLGVNQLASDNKSFFKAKGRILRDLEVAENLWRNRVREWGEVVCSLFFLFFVSWCCCWQKNNGFGDRTHTRTNNKRTGGENNKISHQRLELEQAIKIWGLSLRFCSPLATFLLGFVGKKKKEEGGKGLWFIFPTLCCKRVLGVLVSLDSGTTRKKAVSPCPTKGFGLWFAQMFFTLS